MLSYSEVRYLNLFSATTCSDYEYFLLYSLFPFHLSECPQSRLDLRVLHSKRHRGRIHFYYPLYALLLMQVILVHKRAFKPPLNTLTIVCAPFPDRSYDRRPVVQTSTGALFVGAVSSVSFEHRIRPDRGKSSS